MVRSNEALEAVGALAAGQGGLITVAQARAEGLTRPQIVRLAADGVLERLRHGVYRVTGAPIDPHEELRAAWLAFAPSRTMPERLADPNLEVVSHRSAAVVHDLGDLDADFLEFTAPVRKQSRDRQVRIHRGRVDADEWMRVHGLPVTTIVRTIADLAAARVDGGHLASVVRDAVTTQHADVAKVAAALAPYAHYHGAPLGQGAALIQRMLAEAGVPESTQVAGRLVSSRDLSESARRLLRESGRIAEQQQLREVQQISSGLRDALQALRGVDLSALRALPDYLSAVQSLPKLSPETIKLIEELGGHSASRKALPVADLDADSNSGQIGVGDDTAEAEAEESCGR